MECIVYTEQGKRVFVGGLRMALPIAMMFATNRVDAQIINKSEQYIMCLSNVGNAIRSKIINTKTLNTTVQECPECGSPWNVLHNRCESNCQTIAA